MNSIDTIFVDFTETPCRGCMVKSPKAKMVDLFNSNIGNIFMELTSLEVSGIYDFFFFCP